MQFLRNRLSLGVLALAVSACSSSPTSPTDANLDLSINATHPGGTVGATVPLSLRPFGAAMAAKAFYVTQLDAAAMGRGTLPSPSFPVSVPVGSVPTNVAFNATGTKAYVTNQLSGNVGVVDVATNTQTSTITIAGNPFYVLVSTNQTRLYVSNNSNNVAVVNVATGTVITTIPMPGAPNGMAQSANGKRLFVSVPGAGAVVEVITATNSVGRTFNIGGTPQDLAVSSAADEIYVANEAGHLDVIDTKTGQVTTSVPLPGGGFGLAVSPDYAQIYVAQPAGFLTIVNRATKTIVNTLTLGGTPRKVAFNTQGNRALVANEAGWVDFIQ